MKKPLWLLNLLLLFILLLSIIFAINTRVNLPSTTKTKVGKDVAQQKKQPGLDKNIILANDMFQTISSPIEKPKPKIKELPTLPTPPRKISVVIPRISKPKILDPLPIKATGIVYFGDPQSDSVFILNTRTKSEARYKLSDQVEDAQIIRILSNKVVLLRSNGQQEILYLVQPEQENESPSEKGEFSKVIGGNVYEIDIDNFAKEVPDLNKLIFTFDARNGLYENKIVGIRIGNVDENKLAQSLGIITNDMIEKVNGLSVDTTDNRIKAYESVAAMKPNQEVAVQIKRNNKNIELKYKLKSDAIKSYKTTQPSPFIEENKNLKKEIEKAKTKDLNNVLNLKKAQNENI